MISVMQQIDNKANKLKELNFTPKFIIISEDKYKQLCNEVFAITGEYHLINTYNGMEITMVDWCTLDLQVMPSASETFLYCYHKERCEGD